ncbi:MAG: hypothetical protein ABR77_07500 [Acidimicrobiia bacterium BACL6 MAG-120322-bin79]|jgi:hypothetical protein|nr:MAG: hypothetical protein ABR78_00190 [Acidimicrobiia bacterium BACL6 MAG-120910-bin40]KRO57594.1 MAG: hypothetical protein ABR77_07500 [Acidimicrobiia bacterium BACL6 MAG-120322-bin79]HAG66843.1 hypothetical protein [Acidimicrobium sp.]
MVKLPHSNPKEVLMSTDNASSSISIFSSLENRHTCDESAFTGRKGMRYDWQQMLVPSDAIFEASLQTLLSSFNTQHIDAGDQYSPAAMK